MTACPILIAHRGNLRGPSPPRENRPDYCWAATTFGFDVEIDVWAEDGPEEILWSYGHDGPQYPTTRDDAEVRVYSRHLWMHAKNPLAMETLVAMDRVRYRFPEENLPPLHAFWHQNDDFTLTTCGRIWTFPGKRLTADSICVLPENDPEFDLKNPAAYFTTMPHAICSDYVGDIRENWVVE